MRIKTSTILTKCNLLLLSYLHMHKTKLRNRLHERTMFDKTNPRSLVSMLPDPLMSRIRQAWESDDRPLFSLPEPRLRGELMRRGKPITVTDMKIRLQFWTEYDRTMQVQTPKTSPFDVSRVIGHAITKEAFYDYILDNSRIAWILCPIEDYRLALTEALRNATERLQEFVAGADLKDPRMVTLVRQIEKDLHERNLMLSQLKNPPFGAGAGEEGHNETGDEPASDEDETAGMAREELLASIEAKRKGEAT